MISCRRSFNLLFSSTHEFPVDLDFFSLTILLCQWCVYPALDIGFAWCQGLLWWWSWFTCCKFLNTHDILHLFLSIKNIWRLHFSCLPSTVLSFSCFTLYFFSLSPWITLGIAATPPGSTLCQPSRHVCSVVLTSRVKVACFLVLFFSSHFHLPTLRTLCRRKIPSFVEQRTNFLIGNYT